MANLADDLTVAGYLDDDLELEPAATKSMFDFWKSDGHDFIWITDGYGWQTTRLPLQETFNYTDFVLNIDMVSKGLLEDIVTIPNK